MATIGDPWRKALLLISVTCLFLVLANPYGVATGNLDLDPYTPVRSEVAKTKHGKVMLLSSFDDFYSIRSNFDSRREFGETHVERGYDKVLSAASLGELGSIRIQLTEPYFSQVTATAGDFPVVLYKVVTHATSKNQKLEDARYVLKWGDDVRNEFYQVIRLLSEKGMYSYDYDKSYENGLDANWVFSFPRSTEGLPDIQETAEFQYLAKSGEMDNVTAEVTLIAAYGPSAPTQIIRVIHNGVSTAHTVTASQPAVVKLKLRNGDKVRFSNVLPCRLPQTFQPGEEDWRKYCYGISDIQVRLESQP